MMVANEGKLMAVVPSEWSERVLLAMREHPLGAKSALIGHVVEDRNCHVVVQTTLGSNRVVPMPIGQQLPRIC